MGVVVLRLILPGITMFLALFVVHLLRMDRKLGEQGKILTNIYGGQDEPNSTVWITDNPQEEISVEQNSRKFCHDNNSRLVLLFAEKGAEIDSDLAWLKTLDKLSLKTESGTLDIVVHLRGWRAQRACLRAISQALNGGVLLHKLKLINLHPLALNLRLVENLRYHLKVNLDEVVCYSSRPWNWFWGKCYQHCFKSSSVSREKRHPGFEIKRLYLNPVDSLLN